MLLLFIIYRKLLESLFCLLTSRKCCKIMLLSREKVWSFICNSLHTDLLKWLIKCTAAFFEIWRLLFRIFYDVEFLWWDTGCFTAGISAFRHTLSHFLYRSRIRWCHTRSKIKVERNMEEINKLYFLQF